MIRMWHPFPKRVPPSRVRSALERVSSLIRPHRHPLAVSLPPHVVCFIQQDIHSVSQLEILLLLRDRGGQWSASAVAEELRITSQSAQLHLRDLHTRGLTGEGALAEAYVYAPKSERVRALVDDVASCYVTMRYTVINLIFSEPEGSERPLGELLEPDGSKLE
jgi:hypothetical protein